MTTLSLVWMVSTKLVTNADPRAQIVFADCPVSV